MEIVFGPLSKYKNQRINYVSQGAKQPPRFTFILRLIDAEDRRAGSTHSKPAPDPEAHTQEDVCRNLATRQEVTTNHNEAVADEHVWPPAAS